MLNLENLIRVGQETQVQYDEESMLECRSLVQQITGTPGITQGLLWARICEARQENSQQPAFEQKINTDQVEWLESPRFLIFAFLITCL